METGDLEFGHLTGLMLAPFQLDGWPQASPWSQRLVSSSEDWKLPVPPASGLTPDLSASSSSPVLYTPESLESLEAFLNLVSEHTFLGRVCPLATL